jgi:hypothetical protein
MAPEAGYIDVPPQVHGASDTGRMFYAFHPAEAHPERAPLLVFFNGGPGIATSGILLPFGTGPKTLRWDDLGAGVVDNPAPYTRFANLLYLDERDTGFSYERKKSCAGSPSYLDDAGDFVFALLESLDAHEPIAGAPVVLVGESYGGTRAPVMISLVQHYANLGALAPLLAGSDVVVPDVGREIPWLKERVQAHLDLAFPARAGETWTPEAVTQQVGWEVLIQPNFMGMEQFALQDPAENQDPLFKGAVGEVDPYDVRLSLKEELSRTAAADHLVRDPDTLEALLGVPLESIEGLAAAERGEVVRDVDPSALPAIAADERALRARLGQLGQGDAYFIDQSTLRCGHFLGDAGSAEMLWEELPRTNAFITNARYDSVVYSPEIPKIFALGNAAVTVDDVSPAGAARPGAILIVPPAAPPISIRFPRYESGHEVTMYAGAELGEDVEAWLVATGAIVP